MISLSKGVLAVIGVKFKNPLHSMSGIATAQALSPLVAPWVVEITISCATTGAKVCMLQRSSTC